MPVSGRKPKANPRHRVPPVHDWSEVRDIAFSGGPRLPRCRPGGKAWPRRTKSWWATVSSMPHCVLWSESDWSFAIDTAMLAAEYHDGDIRAATELRQREKILGTTADARRDLRIRYLSAGADEPADDEGAKAPVTRLDDYRDVLGDPG